MDFWSKQIRSIGKEVTHLSCGPCSLSKRRKVFKLRDASPHPRSWAVYAAPRYTSLHRKDRDQPGVGGAFVSHDLRRHTDWWEQAQPLQRRIERRWKTTLGGAVRPVGCSIKLRISAFQTLNWIGESPQFAMLHRASALRLISHPRLPLTVEGMYFVGSDLCALLRSG